MGVSTKTLYRLLHIKELGYVPAGAKILEFGAQNIRCVGDEDIVSSFIDSFHCLSTPPRYNKKTINRLCDQGTMAELMELCGYEYTALDIFESPSTILFDLNNDDVPKELEGYFDLITNFGTTEHILNQHKAFESLHKFAKIGGVIYHDIPLGGYFYHGYFSYNPLFFHHLALANQYNEVGSWFSKMPNDTAFPNPTPAEMVDGGWPDQGFHDAGIEFILQKTSNNPFRTPVDTGTSNDVDADFISSRDQGAMILPGSSAINENAPKTEHVVPPQQQPTVSYKQPSAVGRRGNASIVSRIKRKLATILSG